MSDEHRQAAVERLALTLMPSREHHENCATQSGGDCDCWHRTDWPNCLRRARLIFDADPTIATDLTDAPKLRAVAEAAREMRDDPCASVNWGCDSVQAFDHRLAALDRGAG